jgi:outer membrane protein TolC
MNPAIRTLWTAGVLVLGVARVGWAQTSTPLTLEEAIARGLAQAPRVAEAQALEAAADAEVSGRLAMGRPSLTALASYLRTNHVEEFGVPQPNGAFRVLFPDIPDNVRVRAELTVPLYLGGRVDALLDAARADAQAAAADRRVVEQELTLEITRAYWTLVTARESVAALERTEARMDAWLRDVRARVDAGLLPPNDALTAQAQRARQAVQLVQARHSARTAALDLARLIGAPPDEQIALATPVDRPGAGADLTSATVETLIARAQESRPERAAVAARLEALISTARAAGASLRPQVSALAAVEPARPNARFVPRTDEWRTSWDAGVMVSWPLVDGGRARAERVQAESRAAALSHRLADIDARIALDVRQRLLDVESSRAARAAADEAVAAATEARRVINERFAVGVAVSTDLLDAEVALREAELDRTRLAAALRLAEARLAHAVGALR